MIVDPVTLAPDPASRRLGDHGPLPHLAACRSPTTTAGSSASSPTATCASTTTPTSRIGDVMTRRGPRHRARRHHPRRGPGDPRPAPHREAAGGRRQGRLRAHHGQGHPEEDPVPRRHQGRPGPAARRRGGRHRSRCASNGPRALVEAGVDVLVVDTAHGHSSGVHRRRPQDHRGVPDIPVIAGNVATAEGARRCSTSGPTASRWVSGLDRSAPPGWWPASACRSSPRSTTAPPRPRGYDATVIADGGIQLLGRHREGNRRRRRRRSCSAACSPASTRARARSCSTRASASRSTGAWASLGAMKTRSFSKDRYFQGDVIDAEQARARGHRGPGGLQGAAEPERCTSWSVACGRRWATAGRHHRRLMKQAHSCGSPLPACGESHPHDVTITAKPRTTGSPDRSMTPGRPATKGQ